MTSILITGGAAFIGSHTALVLLDAGQSLVALHNFVNSSPESLGRVLELALVAGDIRNPADLDRAFASASADQPNAAVIHFAGLKAVGESVQHPLRYWDVNLGGSRQLLAAMQAQGCRTLVFSSSATLFGMPERVPIPDGNGPDPADHPLRPQQGGCVEQLLADLVAQRLGWLTQRGLVEMFRDGWAWQSANPSGYGTADPNKESGQ